VLVTGANGYIGSHVTKQLLEAGHVVRGSVRSVSDEQKVGHLMKMCPQAENNLELVEADLTKAETWLQ
jgi:dihydroflavonol-4-reductase